MLMPPTPQCCFDGFHPSMCVRTETAVEVTEAEQPDGSMLADAEFLEISHCMNCSAVLQWRIVDSIPGVVLERHVETQVHTRGSRQVLGDYAGTFGSSD